MGRLETLLAISDMRALVSLPNNDFSWSGWTDVTDALRELDACAHEVTQGRRPTALDMFFLPTGPLQELSLSSGWGGEYVEVAERYHRAMDGEDCACLSPPFSFGAFRQSPVGVDAQGGRFAEVRSDTCGSCGKRFLHYGFEIEGIPRSGRWVRAALPFLGPRLSASSALRLLSLAPFHYVGGSYFSSTGTLQMCRFDPGSL